jgi:putative phosphoesterase
MRIVAISDIHGNTAALDAVLAAVDRERPDEILVLGDLVAFGPDPAGVVDRLRQLHSAMIIRGNCDRYLLEMTEPRTEPMWEAMWWAREQLGDDRMEWIASLPADSRLIVDEVSVLLCHADPATDDGGFFPDEEDTFAKKIALAEETAVACGHTHQPLMRRIGNQVLVNDGSVGFPYDGNPKPSYAVLEISDGKVAKGAIKRVKYDNESVAVALRAIDLPMMQTMAERVLAGRLIKSQE